VGEEEALDFTALGDAVNTAARLASSAAAGEILVTVEAASAAGLKSEGPELRVLELRGRSEQVKAWVLAV
jgi:adenylate cyclase